MPVDTFLSVRTFPEPAVEGFFDSVKKVLADLEMGTEKHVKVTNQSPLVILILTLSSPYAKTITFSIGASLKLIWSVVIRLCIHHLILIVTMKIVAFALLSSPINYLK